MKNYALKEEKIMKYRIMGMQVKIKRETIKERGLICFKNRCGLHSRPLVPL